MYKRLLGFLDLFQNDRSHESVVNCNMWTKNVKEIVVWLVYCVLYYTSTLVYCGLVLSIKVILHVACGILLLLASISMIRSETIISRTSPGSSHETFTGTTVLGSAEPFVLDKCMKHKLNLVIISIDTQKCDTSSYRNISVMVVRSLNAD